MNHLSFHIQTTSLMGTADHLVKRHGMTEEELDRDDRHGLIADHIRLHGGTVTPDSRFHLPGSITPDDIKSAHKTPVTVMANLAPDRRDLVVEFIHNEGDLLDTRISAPQIDIILREPTPEERRNGVRWVQRIA